MDKNAQNAHRMGYLRGCNHQITHLWALFSLDNFSIYFDGVSPHALHKTAATNALEHDADIKRVKDWLGHSDISTTQVYDGRQT